MSNGRNGSFLSAARWRRKSSNIVFQELEWITAVEVRTPSMSNSTASNRSGVMGLCARLMPAPLVCGDTSSRRQQGWPCWRRGLVLSFLLLHVVALGRGAASGASRRGAVPRRPAPARDLRHVVAVLPNVVLVLEQLLLDRLLEIGGAGAQLRQPGDHGLHQMEAVRVVEHHHVEGRRGRALLPVAVHV